MNLKYCDLGRLSYRDAWQLQEVLRGQRIEGRVPDTFLLLEHPPVITLGRRAKEADILLDSEGLRSRGVEVVRIDRGGEVTYHGPGQLVGYLIFHLSVTNGSIKRFVHLLEETLIRTLSHWGIEAGRHPFHRGVWVGSDKIAALGLSVSHQVTTHGFALNVSTDLFAFRWIVPCGIKEGGVTSMERILSRRVTLEEVRPVVLKELAGTFGFTDVSAVDLSLRGWGSGSRRSHQLASETPSSDLGHIHTPNSTHPHPPPLRKPEWLKVPVRSGGELSTVQSVLNRYALNTVCKEANCPNRMECYSRKTATFLILGPLCTRNCTFCNVTPGSPAPPDPEEPERVLAAVQALGLRYAVITSVTRDDLPDGGAFHFARTIRLLKEKLPQVQVEVLIPDFRGDPEALWTVLEAGPDVLNHNVETVPRLYLEVRPQAVYSRSLDLLRRAKEYAKGSEGPTGTTGRSFHRKPTASLANELPFRTKSGIMVGLGETEEEVVSVLKDLRQVGCDYLSIGQYLAPSRDHHPVVEYVTPQQFARYRDIARELGFSAVASGPFVRSSYHAAEMAGG